MLNDEFNDLEQNSPFSEALLTEQDRLLLDEIILEVQRSMDYYVSHFNQRPVAKIIFAPLERELNGVFEYISDMLGVSCEVLDFNRYLDVQRPLDVSLQAHCYEAIGLALRKEVEKSMAAG